MNGNNQVDQVIAAMAARLGQSRRQVMREWELDYFSYQHTFIPLAASANATANFLVQNDSGFVIVKTMGTVATAANVFQANISDSPKFTPITLIWSDSGSGRDLMNAAASWDNVIGNGQRPYYWPKPKILDPNSTFTIRVTNLVATAWNVRITYGGYKVFKNVAAYKASH